MVKLILSIDGGGIRGLIPATILAEMEKKAKKPLAEIFDLMAGTSTGGLCVAGLCKTNEEGKPQYTAADIVNLYKNHGKEIFSSAIWSLKLLTLQNCVQYTSTNLEKILKKYFGESLVADVACHMLLTSYDIYNENPFFFKSWKSERNYFKLRDALRATTAAPTFFKPKKLKGKDQEKLVLIDGGVFANNPAACAYASAKTLYPNDEIRILSIGTGRTCQTFENIKWITQLLHVMFASSLDCVNYQLNQTIGDKYVRIQSNLKIASPQVDNCTEENIENLQQEAYAMCEEHQELIDQFLSHYHNSTHQLEIEQN